MLSGGWEKSLIGNTTLSSLLGQSQTGALVGALGKYAGLNEHSTTSLLGALTPGGLDQEVTGAVDSVTSALNGITDAASAEAALPNLSEIDANLDGLGGLVGQLPAVGKSALAALINGALPALEALIAKVSETPGVAEVIKPTADAMVAKLKAMAA